MGNTTTKKRTPTAEATPAKTKAVTPKAKHEVLMKRIVRDIETLAEASMNEVLGGTGSQARLHWFALAVRLDETRLLAALTATAVFVESRGLG